MTNDNLGEFVYAYRSIHCLTVGMWTQLSSSSAMSKAGDNDAETSIKNMCCQFDSAQVHALSP